MKEPKYTPQQERELVESTLNRKNRRRFNQAHRKLKQPEWEYPDFMKGMSNHGRMMLKKVARSGAETRSRQRRNRRK